MLSPAKAAMLARLSRSCVAIGTAAPASAACCSQCCPTPQLLGPAQPLCPDPPLAHQLPASSSFLGNNQLAAVAAANYCISYNLPIHLSHPLPPTLEHFHLSNLSTFTLAVLSDSHPLFCCTPWAQSLAVLLYPFLLLPLPNTSSVLISSTSHSTLSPSPSPPVSFPLDPLPTTSGYSFT